MNSRPLLLIGLSAGLLTFFQPAIARAQVRVDIAATREKVWIATVATLIERGIPIAIIDQASGFIAGEIDPAPGNTKGFGSKEAKYASCGEDAPTSMMYMVFLEGSRSSTSNLLVNTRWTSRYQQEDRNRGRFTPITTTCNSKSLWESELQAAIKSKAETSP